MAYVIDWRQYIGDEFQVNSFHNYLSFAAIIRIKILSMYDVDNKEV